MNRRLRHLWGLRILGVRMRWSFVALLPLLAGGTLLLCRWLHNLEQETIFQDAVAHGVVHRPRSRAGGFGAWLFGSTPVILVDDRGTSVHLIGGKVDDALVARASRLDRLEQLSLMDCPVTDASIPVLVSLPELKSLRLNGTRISEGGLARLRAARPSVDISCAYGADLTPYIEDVVAAGGDLTVTPSGDILIEFRDGPDVWHVGQAMRQASIARSGITDASLDALQPLDEHLSCELGVWLRHPKLTSNALKALVPLKRLRAVRIEPGTGIGADAIDEFRRERRDVEVSGRGATAPP